MKDRQNNTFVRNEDIEDLSEGTRWSFESAICENVGAVMIQDRKKDWTGENKSHVADTLMNALNIASVKGFCGLNSFIFAFQSV